MAEALTAADRVSVQALDRALRASSTSSPYVTIRYHTSAYVSILVKQGYLRSLKARILEVFKSKDT